MMFSGQLAVWNYTPQPRITNIKLQMHFMLPRKSTPIDNSHIWAHLSSCTKNWISYRFFHPFTWREIRFSQCTQFTAVLHFPRNFTRKINSYKRTVAIELIYQGLNLVKIFPLIYMEGDKNLKMCSIDCLLPVIQLSNSWRLGSKILHSGSLLQNPRSNNLLEWTLLKPKGFTLNGI